MAQENVVWDLKKIGSHSERLSPNLTRSFIDTATIRFQLEAVDPLALPPYKGSTLRGGFGSALRRLSCRNGTGSCRGCGAKASCVYSLIFDSPLPLESIKMKRAEAVPHPFVIEPPLEDKRFFSPGDRMAFSLILIGWGIEHFETIFDALKSMGDQGIGKKRGRVRVKQISNPDHCRICFVSDSSFTNWKLVLAPPNETTDTSVSEKPSLFSLFFLTPTRICINNLPISEKDFSLPILIKNLIRRISLLHYFHCGGDSVDCDFRGLIEAAASVKVVRNDLEWYDWERYSSRRDTRMTLGGFIGNISFEGSLEPLLPILRAGEVLHAGKNTTFGLGKYFVQTHKDESDIINF